MNWAAMQPVAQILVEHIFNALPAGFAVAFFAWGLLRLLRRQNSGTRFAVWFVALMAVVALPVLGLFNVGMFYFGRGLLLSHAGLRAPISIPEHWALLIFMVWIVGASAGLLRLLFGIWRLRKLRQSCTAIDVSMLDPAVRKTIETVVASKPVVITTSETLRVPAAIGLWGRTIVLPAWALRELAPEDLNVILLHEFAHLRRADDWTNLIQKIVRALFFFHPAVWWIDERLSVEREMACDDTVLAQTANPRGYANCLVSLLERSLADRGWAMAQAAVHRAREASLRLAQILNKNRPVATKVWTPAVGIVSVFSVMCLAALPNSPQLVAFDHAATVVATHRPDSVANQSGRESMLADNRLAIGEARVVPARLDTSSLSGEESGYAHRSGARFAKRGVRHGKPAPLRQRPTVVAAAQLNAVSPKLVETHAASDQAPQFQTLVFIERTQYMTSDGPVVETWRVTWISMPQEKASRIPVVNSL
jgi:beta-lactamase regulating signal transducer with metallopeptidase domain